MADDEGEDGADADGDDAAVGDAAAGDAAAGDAALLSALVKNGKKPTIAVVASATPEAARFTRHCSRVAR
jgi:hypothetical protein